MTNASNPKPGRKPTHVAYQVRERQNQKSIWNRIGALWPHKDGKGFHFDIEAVPLSGRIVFRVPSPKKK